MDFSRWGFYLSIIALVVSLIGLAVALWSRWTQKRSDKERDRNDHLTHRMQEKQLEQKPNNAEFVRDEEGKATHLRHKESVTEGIEVGVVDIKGELKTVKKDNDD